MLKALQEGVGDMPFICHPTGNQTMKCGEGLPVEVAVKTCEEIEKVV